MLLNGIGVYRELIIVIACLEHSSPTNVLPWDQFLCEKISIGPFSHGFWSPLDRFSAKILVPLDTLFGTVFH